MGAQAAALLASGGPVGEVPAAWTPTDGGRLDGPLGRWAGSVMWLDVSARWLGRAHSGSAAASAS